MTLWLGNVSMDSLRLLDQIGTSRSDRDVMSGVPSESPRGSADVHPFHALYGPESLAAIARIEVAAGKAITDRMRVRATAWYAQRAAFSDSMARIVVASADELLDSSGTETPSAQLTYCPFPGIRHLYSDTVSLTICRTCSCSCRHCYQRDLISGDGGVGIVSATLAADYIHTFNRSQATDQVTTALLTGGDPLVMENRALLRYLIAIAAVGVRTIRIATKELAFFPQRFDAAFFNALDLFHQSYPAVRLIFVLHFSHSDELTVLPRLSPDRSKSSVVKEVQDALFQFQRRQSFIRLFNQTPIIAGVNDSPSALAELQLLMSDCGICNYYFFQCRPILGYKAFAVPIERALAIVEESQQRLSGTDSQALFVLSTSVGKLQVAGVSARTGDSEIVFKLVRPPFRQDSRRGALIVARTNCDALWLSDYLDRIVFDGTKQLGHVDADTL